MDKHHNISLGRRLIGIIFLESVCYEKFNFLLIYFFLTRNRWNVTITNFHLFSGFLNPFFFFQTWFFHDDFFSFRGQFGAFHASIALDNEQHLNNFIILGATKKICTFFDSPKSFEKNIFLNYFSKNFRLSKMCRSFS